MSSKFIVINESHHDSNKVIRYSNIMIIKINCNTYYWKQAQSLVTKIVAFQHRNERIKDLETCKAFMFS